MEFHFRIKAFIQATFAKLSHIFLKQMTVCSGSLQAAAAVFRNQVDPEGSTVNSVDLHHSPGCPHLL